MTATGAIDTDRETVDSVLNELAAEARKSGPSVDLSRETLERLLERRFWQYERRDELLESYRSGALPPIGALQRLGVAADERSTDPVGFFRDGRHVAVDSPGSAYDSEPAVHVDDESVEPGADIAGLLNDHRGERIVVPDGTYAIEETVRVTDGTTLVFDGTTIETEDGRNYNLFECTGDGWHVGGDLTVDQSGSYPWIRVSGTGQFGDANGRLTFRGSCPDEVIGVKRQSHNRWFVTEGEPGDAIVLKNVDQYEAPPYDECADTNFTWTEFPGLMTVVGCHLGNFHDNGFYYKAMQGRVEIYDTFFENMNVAAIRFGCDHGAVLKRCLVLDDGNYNPARTAGRTCRGVNHSVVALQDLNGVTGDVTLEEVYYQKGDDPKGGEFLRTMLDHHGDPDLCTVTVRDCRWPGYPEIGSATDTKWVLVREEGENGADPSAAARRPYPLGGGDPSSADPLRVGTTDE